MDQRDSCYGVNLSKGSRGHHCAAKPCIYSRESSKCIQAREPRSGVPPSRFSSQFDPLSICWAPGFSCSFMSAHSLEAGPDATFPRRFHSSARLQKPTATTDEAGMTRFRLEQFST